MLNWVLAFLLAISPIASSAAYAASTADAPCPMSASADSGSAPCGDCSDSAASCAQLCAGMLAQRDAVTTLSHVSAERVIVRASDVFRSRAGPPGLQPPR